jgi:hypothetical protein
VPPVFAAPVPSPIRKAAPVAPDSAPELRANVPLLATEVSEAAASAMASRYSAGDDRGFS